MNLPHTRSVTIVPGTQYVVAFNLDAVTGFDWEDVTWVCKVRDRISGTLLASPTVVSVTDTDGSASVVAVFEGAQTATMPPAIRMEISGRMTAPVWGPHTIIRRDMSVEGRLVPVTSDF